MNSNTRSSISDKSIEAKAAQKLAQLRVDKSLTQRELADQVGVTESTIANWESGRRRLDWLVRSKKLCGALSCKLEDLVEDETLEEPTFEELLAMYKKGKIGK